jgi:hypothetical protein
MGSDIFNMVRTSIIHRLISLGAVYILDATDRGSPLGERFARRPRLRCLFFHHKGKGRCTNQCPREGGRCPIHYHSGKGGCPIHYHSGKGGHPIHYHSGKGRASSAADRGITASTGILIDINMRVQLHVNINTPTGMR